MFWTNFIDELRKIKQELWLYVVEVNDPLNSLNDPFDANKKFRVCKDWLILQMCEDQRQAYVVLWQEYEKAISGEENLTNEEN